MRGHVVVGAATAVAVLFAAPWSAAASSALTPLSSDPYTNTTSQHHTEVEPDTFAFGSTEVSAFQVGRFFDGGSSNIGWATSTDAGQTWTNGFLPGITIFAGGSYDRVSDPSVAYDAKHTTWLISSLPLTGTNGAAVVASRSIDGGHTWTAPATVTAPPAGGLDKDWIACDSTATSPHYGNCYVEWDDNGNGNLVYMSTSTDGGLTWGGPHTTANHATGLGGQPLVQPNGTVVVPMANANETGVLSFVSTDGGATWSATSTVANTRTHVEAGGLRSGMLPSAEVDASGRVVTVWQDCRFEKRCRANDIVMSSSTDGVHWSSVTRIPIDSVGSGVDHFIPGIAVDRSSSGSTGHMALTYYYYPVSACSTSTCKLDVGFVSSSDGGAHWAAAAQLAGPMSLAWLASTSQGSMVGDYISTSFAAGRAIPVFAVAAAPSNNQLNESMYAPAGGLAVHSA